MAIRGITRSFFLGIRPPFLFCFEKIRGQRFIWIPREETAPPRDYSKNLFYKRSRMKKIGGIRYFSRKKTLFQQKSPGPGVSRESPGEFSGDEGWTH
jgi:hypothetical protein